MSRIRRLSGPSSDPCSGVLGGTAAATASGMKEFFEASSAGARMNRSTEGVGKRLKPGVGKRPPKDVGKGPSPVDVAEMAVADEDRRDVEDCVGATAAGLELELSLGLGLALPLALEGVSALGLAGAMILGMEGGLTAPGLPFARAARLSGAGRAAAAVASLAARMRHSLPRIDSIRIVSVGVERAVNSYFKLTSETSISKQTRENNRNEYLDDFKINVWPSSTLIILDIDCLASDQASFTSAKI